MTNKNAWISALVLPLLAFQPVLADPDAPVTVIDTVDLEEFDNLDTEKIFEMFGLPGRDQQGQAPRLRGFGESGGPRVLVNGTQVSPRTGPDGDFVETPVGLIPAEFVKRVEVLPGGGLYGSSAAAGVVNIVPSDRYRGFNPTASWLLPPIQRALGSTWTAVQSNEYCDATNGAFQPSWSLFPSYDYGLPYFTPDGGTAFFGDKSKGFDAGGAASFAPLSDWPIKDPYFLPDTSVNHTQFQKLLDRIFNDPTISDEAKGIFALISGFTLYSDPDSVSDTAYLLGEFDPEGMYQELKESAAGQAGETESGSTGAASTGSGEAATTTPVAENPPHPFNEYKFPPDYSFDFSLCSDEQRETALGIIAEREAATAEWLYWVDYTRIGYRSQREIDRDEQMATSAHNTRVQKNEELRTHWLNCIGPEETSASQSGQAGLSAATDPTVEPTTPQDAGSTEPAPADTDEPVIGDTDPAAADPTDMVVDDTSPDDRPPLSWGRYFGSLPWNFEVHVEKDVWGKDGSQGTEAVRGLAIDVKPYNPWLQFGVPFTSAGRRDIEFDSSAGSSRVFTDDRGVARVVDAFRTGDVSRLPAGPFGLAFGYEHREDDDFFTGDTAAILPGSGSEQRQIDRDAGGLDWQIFADYDFGRIRNGPTIGVKFKFNELESIVQEFPAPVVSFPWKYIDEDFTFSSGQSASPILEGAGKPFKIGDYLYNTYNYYGFPVLDYSLLDNVPGQSGWSNNFCGDAALPPEGAGYLTANMSPVKSIDDRWALEHVGLAKNESISDENAEPIIVGIIDTGLDWNHLDFAWDNLWRNADEIPDNGIDDDGNGYVDDIIGWNFTGENNRPWDNDGHGTFVAGIIAATHGNDAGIDGINPNARIMVLKALNNFGRTRASYIAKAIVYGADNGARILNLSVMGPGFPKVVQEAVNYAESKGVLVIMAAGNHAEDIDNAQPARLRRVMAVAATGPDDKRATFSNVGSAINIAAPGVDVVSLRARATDFMYNSAETSYVPGDAYLGEDSRYYRGTGTSFAAPIVSGVASLVWANRPELSRDEVKRILEQSARDIETPGRDRFTGYGVVDAKAALAADPAFYIHADIPSVRRLDADDQVFLQVVGVADADQFGRATLDIGQGAEPESWNGTGPVILERLRLGELGRIPAEELEGAQTWTIRLTVEHQNGRKREARYVVDLD